MTAGGLFSSPAGGIDPNFVHSPTQIYAREARLRQLSAISAESSRQGSELENNVANMEPAMIKLRLHQLERMSEIKMKIMDRFLKSNQTPRFVALRNADVPYLGSQLPPKEQFFAYIPLFISRRRKIWPRPKRLTKRRRRIIC